LKNDFIRLRGFIQRGGTVLVLVLVESQEDSCDQNRRKSSGDVPNFTTNRTCQFVDLFFGDALITILVDQGGGVGGSTPPFAQVDSIIPFVIKLALAEFDHSGTSGNFNRRRRCGEDEGAYSGDQRVSCHKRRVSLPGITDCDTLERRSSFVAPQKSLGTPSSRP
jgi:hypothetical protein